jgi:hypothetical protein
VRGRGVGEEDEAVVVAAVVVVGIEVGRVEVEVEVGARRGEEQPVLSSSLRGLGVVAKGPVSFFCTSSALSRSPCSPS